MPKLSEKSRRRESTVARDNEVHKLYEKIKNELGDLACVVSKSYVYNKIREKTKLSIRAISFILNHTRGEN